MQEDANANRCVVQRTPSELREVLVAGRARVTGRRDAAPQVDQWIDTPRAALVPVPVQVHQARRDDRARDVDVYRRAAGRRSRLQQADDPTVANRHVGRPIKALGWIDDTPAPQDELTHRLPPPSSTERVSGSREAAVRPLAPKPTSPPTRAADHDHLVRAYIRHGGTRTSGPSAGGLAPRSLAE